jgi:7,8-dihydropterin-6-yl-methyl-4-(beta-D-ribofuranosyl)aminobenzene 5'-phosphate synthase
MYGGAGMPINEHQTMRGVFTPSEVDRLIITVITDNYYDSVRVNPPSGKRLKASPGVSIHAEHGLSYHVETVVDNRSYFFMFDYGLDPIGVMNNIELLGIDLGKVNAFGLSHGHFDHWSGMIDILERGAPGTPLYVGEETFVHRYALRPGSEELTDLEQLEREAIEKQGIARIVEVREPVEVIPGCYMTGQIERVTEYEKGSPYLLIKRDKELEQDYFPGEQALVCSVKGRGLVVISGCAHAGIINTVRHAQKITGIGKVHVVIGGFHLVNAAPEIIERTVADMQEIGPDHIIPAHCTGFEAILSFASKMPHQFVLNTAGVQYAFGA